MYTKNPRKRLLDVAVVGSALAVVAWGLLGCAAESKPTQVQKAEQAVPASSGPTPVKLAAKRAKAKPFGDGIVITGGPYTCLRATVQNNTKANLEVNPLYFAVTGTDGEKREVAVGVSKDEFDTLTLAPG